MMIEDCTAIVLAGGESKRMGTDKASLFLGRQTLLEHTFQKVSPLFSEAYVSVRELRNHVQYPQIQDISTERSPMMGIAAALKHCSTSWIFVVACDMPFIAPELIIQMEKQRNTYQMVVPECQGFKQPLLAFYHQSCLPVMQTKISKGQRGLQGLIRSLNAKVLDEHWLKQYDADLKSFFDLDTKEDLKVAENSILNVFNKNLGE